MQHFFTLHHTRAPWLSFSKAACMPHKTDQRTKMNNANMVRARKTDHLNTTLVTVSARQCSHLLMCGSPSSDCGPWLFARTFVAAERESAFVAMIRSDKWASATQSHPKCDNKKKPNRIRCEIGSRTWCNADIYWFLPYRRVREHGCVHITLCKV